MKTSKYFLVGLFFFLTGYAQAAVISFLEGAEGTPVTVVVGAGWITAPVCAASPELVTCSFGTFLDSGPNTGATNGNSFIVNRAFLVEALADLHDGETSDLVSMFWQRFDGLVTASFTFQSPEPPFAPPGTDDVPGRVCNGIQESGTPQQVVFCGPIPNDGNIPSELQVFVSSDLDNPVPEPMPLALMFIGLVGIARLRRRLN